MRPFLLSLAILVALAARTAQAQTTTDLAAMPTDGLEQIGASAAIADRADAVVVNPAGLGFARGLSLRYLHQEGSRSGVADESNGDGLYVGARLLGPLSAGFAVEWLRHRPAIGDLRRTTWALALGGDAISVGANVHLFSADRPALEDVVSVDLGAMTRPARWLSIGLAVRDVDAPRLGGVDLPRRWVGAVGLRPFGDWLTLGAEGVVLDGDGPAAGFDAMRLGWLATADVRPGFRLFGALSHRIDGADPLAAQIGLALDFGHLGVEATPVLRSGGEAGGLLALELHSAARPGLLGRRRGTAALVDLDRALARDDGIRLLPGEARDPMIDAVEGLRALGADPAVEVLVVRIRPLPDVGQGEAFELRRALLDFRAGGKRLVAILEGGGDTEYYVASAAERVLATPEAALFVNGFSTNVNFFAGTLGLIGVEVEATKIGAYKNAPDVLTREAITEANAEVVESILDDLYERYVADVAEARGIEPDRFRAALATGIQSPALARELGLVDGVVAMEDLEQDLRGFVGAPVALRERALRPEAPTSWGPAPVIAVIPIEGTITGGRTGGDFGLLTTTGARTVVEAIDRAADDPDVKAIVLRIDSGGGDAAGSQRIWRAVQRARGKKPIVATMGDAAASGGYYAAVAADRIFAAPGTMTGSIGIFWLKPSLEGLLGKLEVGRYRSVRGPLADIGSIQDGWDEAERAAMDRYVESAYRDFVQAVADGRGLSFEAADERARGRVWTGAQARARGLVDDLGGLPAALRWAREQAGIPEDRPVTYRVHRPSAALLAGADFGFSAKVQLPAPLERALREGLPPALLLPEGSGLWALAPFDLRVD